MKAIYTESPKPKSLTVCQYCMDAFPDIDCAECLNPTVSEVEVLEIFVGHNRDRANIEFHDGKIKNVCVNTLQILRSAT